MGKRRREAEEGRKGERGRERGNGEEGKEEGTGTKGQEGRRTMVIGRGWRGRVKRQGE